MKANPNPPGSAKPSIPLHLYLWALIVIVAVRLGLTLSSYQRLERLMPPAARHRDMRRAPWEVAWTVKRMATFVPFASCLTQALSLQFLLGRRGEVSTICIGVAPGAPGRFAAHAWLLWDNQVIIGGDKNLNDFKTIARLEARAN